MLFPYIEISNIVYMSCPKGRCLLHRLMKSLPTQIVTQSYRMHMALKTSFQYSMCKSQQLTDHLKNTKL